MSETLEIKATDVQSVHSMEIPPNIRPEDVLQKIDLARAQVADEVEPGFFERLTNPGARERASEIERVMTARIAARRVLIEEMTSMLDLYVSAHKGDLKIRAYSFVTARFAELRAKLFEAMERSQTSFLETFSGDVERINVLANLTVEQKAQNLARAYQRTLDAQADAHAAYAAILDQIKIQVLRVVDDIEGTAS